MDGEEDVECNFIDLGVLEVSEDIPTRIVDPDYFLPPVPREASGFSLTGQEVLARGGSIGYHTDFYKTQVPDGLEDRPADTLGKGEKTQKIRASQITTEWSQPQQKLQQALPPGLCGSAI